jgi:hypothetical protein
VAEAEDVADAEELAVKLNVELRLREDDLVEEPVLAGDLEADAERLRVAVEDLRPLAVRDPEATGAAERLIAEVDEGDDVDVRRLNPTKCRRMKRSPSSSQWSWRSELPTGTAF